MVQTGCEPIEAWTATWEQIATYLEIVNPRLGEQVRLLLSAVRASHDRDVAETALRVLARICAEHLHDDRLENYPIVS